MAFPTSATDQITDAATLDEVTTASRSKMKSGRHSGRSEPGSHGEHTATSVRTATHKGREIRIETSYKITVDGEPVGGHVVVGDDGKVHYHSIPNQEFRSAVDMVKRLIDLTPPRPQDAASAYAEEEG